ncbi:MAG: hypothetical protein ACLQVI_20585 [Polyangiaceae bacterium]
MRDPPLQQVPRGTRARPTVVELTQVAVGAPLHDGRRASSVRVGIFASFEKAHGWTKQRRERGRDDGYALVFYRADELVLDYAGRVCRSRIFDGDGRLRGECTGGVGRPWAGRDPATCRYKPGDRVALVPNDAYRIGVVLGQPISHVEARRMGNMVTLGDDSYLVGLVDPDAPLDPDRYDHEHVVEAELFDPPLEVPEELRAALGRRCLGREGFPPCPGLREEVT